MQVSIIIPVHGRVISTLVTLNSIDFLNYEREQMEVIVVLDGKNEKLKDLLKGRPFNYDLKILDLKPSSHGASAARNFGARLAKGELLLFLDSDIIVSPDLLKSHIAIHRICERVVVLGKRFLMSEGQTRSYRKGTFGLTQHNESRLLCDDEREDFWKNTYGTENIFNTTWKCLYSHNFSIRKTDLKGIGYFDEEFIGCGVEDIELGYRLAKKGYSIKVNRAAFGFHQYHKRRTKRWQSNFRNIERLISLYPELIDFYKEVKLDWYSKRPDLFPGDNHVR